MRSLLDVQAVMKGHSKVLSDIIQNVARGEDIVRATFRPAETSTYLGQTNAKERYLLLADDMNAEYDSKTTRQKYAKNEQYVSFKETIYVRLLVHDDQALTLHFQEVDHSGQAMPPITDFIPRGMHLRASRPYSLIVVYRAQ